MRFERIGRYDVTALLGASARAGMGEVYQTRVTTLDRDVALKVEPTTGGWSGRVGACSVQPRYSSSDRLHVDGEGLVDARDARTAFRLPVLFAVSRPTAVEIDRARPRSP